MPKVQTRDLQRAWKKKETSSCRVPRTTVAAIEAPEFEKSEINLDRHRFP